MGVENDDFCALKLRFADIIDFLLPFEKDASESHRMLVRAYGGHAPSNPQCCRWFEEFRSGDFDVRNKEPKKFEDAELQVLLYEDDGQTQQKLAEQLHVSQQTVS